jgi:hypothetical protein
MPALFRISCRTGLSCALVLAVLLVPLAHSAHYHDGGSDGDASLNATCVVCQVSGGYIASSPQTVDSPTIFQSEPAPAPQSSRMVKTAGLVTAPQRAPPFSF